MWLCLKSHNKKKTDAYLVNILVNPLEASIDNHVFDQRGHVHDATRPMGCVAELVLPSIVRTVDRQGVVVCRTPRLKVQNLDPSAGFEVIHALSEQAWPVGYRTSHVRDPDPVELLVEIPVCLAVVHLFVAVSLVGPGRCAGDLAFSKLEGENLTWNCILGGIQVG